MTYTLPQAVTSPRDYIKKIHVIHDGGDRGYSVAKLEWEDPDKVSGQKVCVGMPSSHGYPVWFVLPEDILNKESEVRKPIDAAWPTDANSKPYTIA